MERQRSGSHRTCRGIQRCSDALISRWRADVSRSRLYAGASGGTGCLRGIGVVSGVLSLAFTKIIVIFRPMLRALPEWTQYFQPAAAGLLIGLVGLKVPQSMGTGYPYIDQALHSQYTWQILALLGFAKILTTSLSFVSGTPGGMFAPTLFIGAMIGGAIGGLEHQFFPQVSASVAPFALVGMGTFFAGFHAGSDHVRIYGRGNHGKLLDRFARDDFQHDCVFDFAALPG